MTKTFYFGVSGKLEADDEADATDKIHYLELTQFQIDSLQEE